jgi:hypothetical protein
MSADEQSSNIDLGGLCQILREEFDQETLLELCRELHLNGEQLGLTIDLTLGILFLVGTLHDQQRIPDLLTACNQIRPQFSEKLSKPISTEWKPKASLSGEVIELINGVLGFSGQPYVIDESPSSFSNWQPVLRSTDCYCWLSGILSRGAYDHSESEPLWDLLFQVREVIKHYRQPIMAYIGRKRTWGEGGMGDVDCIVVAPSSDQFDALRIEEIEDGNCDLDTENWLREIKHLDKQFGVDIIAVYDGSLTIQLKRLPSQEELGELNRWLQTFTKSDEHPHKLQLEDLRQPFDVWCDD